MNRPCHLAPHYKSQRGLGLVSAIFVITVLALIAAGIAGITANSARQHSQQILTIRAQSAAQSGLEIHSAHLQAKYPCSSAAVAYTFATQGLFDCRAKVSCSVVSLQAKHFITLESLGTCGSGFDLASRAVEKRWLRQ